jgi:hypothetical protein
MTKLPANVGIIACKVFEPELISLGIKESQVVYLDQGLHRYPKDLCKTLADTLNGLEKNETIEKVILCYGYCGGGLEGLTSKRLELVLPLAHDCIPILLGACSASPCVNCGNIFYLSPGWIEHGLTPYTEYFATAEKFSAEDALWIGKQMLKDYREVVLIKTAAPMKRDYPHYAKDMARLFGLNYRETLGKKDWLLKLFAAENNDAVRVIASGTKVDLKLYPMPQVIS